MPYEKATDNLDEFSYQLSVIESILGLHSDCHVIVGGDLT